MTWSGASSGKSAHQKVQPAPWRAPFSKSSRPWRRPEGQAASVAPVLLRPPLPFRGVDPTAAPVAGSSPAADRRRGGGPGPVGAGPKCGTGTDRLPAILAEYNRRIADLFAQEADGAIWDSFPGGGLGHATQSLPDPPSHVLL